MNKRMCECDDVDCCCEEPARYIYNNILPQFIYYFHFLLQRHKSNCFTVINNYINCINHHQCQNKIYLTF